MNNQNSCAQWKIFCQDFQVHFFNTWEHYMQGRRGRRRKNVDGDFEAPATPRSPATPMQPPQTPMTPQVSGMR